MRRSQRQRAPRLRPPSALPAVGRRHEVARGAEERQAPRGRTASAPPRCRTGTQFYFNLRALSDRKGPSERLPFTFQGTVIFFEMRDSPFTLKAKSGLHSDWKLERPWLFLSRFTLVRYGPPILVCSLFKRLRRPNPH